MLKKLNLCALLLTTCVGSLAANWDNTDGQWRFTAEYLYWKPSVDDTYFVIDSPVSTTFPNGRRKDNNLHFNSGYRLGGGYQFCDCGELSLTYTHLDFKQSKTVSGDFLWATLGVPDVVSSFENYTGSARSHLKFHYQRFDVLYAQQIIENCCGLDVGLAFGLEAAELKLNESYLYQSATHTATFNQRSKTNVVGPELGFTLGYELYKGSECDCMPGTLSFNVFSSGSILAARTRSNLNNVEDAVTFLDVSNSKSWRIIPAFHSCVSLNYDMAFSCVDASIGIGYEFSSYIRGISRTTFPDDVADGLCFNHYDNFDMQGLVVSGTVRF